MKVKINKVNAKTCALVAEQLSALTKPLSPEMFRWLMQGVASYKSGVSVGSSRQLS